MVKETYCQTEDVGPLDQKLCFSLYATSRLMTRIYEPLLKTIDITYPQFLVMLCLWGEMVSLPLETRPVVKGVSSRMIRRKNHPSISQSLWGGSLWSPSYFAGSCGGKPIEIIRKYIEDQATPS